MTDAFETGSSDTEGASGNVGPDTQKLADKTMDNAAQEKLKKQREEWLASRKKPGLQPGAKSVGNTTSSK